MKRKEPFDIPSITESLANDVASGRITLHEAAVELHEAGWMNFLALDRTRRLLGLDCQDTDKKE